MPCGLILIGFFFMSLTAQFIRAYIISIGFIKYIWLVGAIITGLIGVGLMLIGLFGTVIDMLYIIFPKFIPKEDLKGFRDDLK